MGILLVLVLNNEIPYDERGELDGETESAAAAPGALGARRRGARRAAESWGLHFAV